jgi:cobalt/nickel transport system permease protein
MHISEGVLSLPVISVGFAITAVGTWMGLKKIDSEKLVTVALLSSVFFVASLIHIPIGPSSAHLIMSGLLGLMLGWAAFPAILTGLLLQAVLFQYGGLTSIGVNTADMALPAVIFYFLFKGLVSRGGKYMSIGTFLCGALSIAGSSIMTAAALSFSDDSFIEAAQAIIYAHIPIMLAEGLICMFAYGFIHKVRPEMLVPESVS